MASSSKKGSTSKAAFLASVPDPEPAGPIVAAPGTDWSQQLIKLAKTAELKKHTLSLQIHTADIVNAQSSLEEKSKALADIRTEKNWLESERERLLTALREINVDRERVDLAEAQIANSIREFEKTVEVVRDTEYATARATVDTLRQELDLPPLPSLQDTLAEKAAYILEERRKHGPAASGSGGAGGTVPKKRGRPPKKRESDLAGLPLGDVSFSITDPNLHNGNGNGTAGVVGIGGEGEPSPKRPRGRPKGSKNKAKEVGMEGGDVFMP